MPDHAVVSAHANTDKKQLPRLIIYLMLYGHLVAVRPHATLIKDNRESRAVTPQAFSPNMYEYIKALVSLWLHLFC